MAKFNIEVELDWLEENSGSIDEILKREIVNDIRNSITAKAQKEIELKLAEIVTAESERIVSVFLGKTFEQKIESLQIPYKPDKWGSAVEYMPLGEFVGMQYAEHLNKKVFDYQGRTPDRPSEAKISITEYFLKNYLEKELTKKVETLIQKARMDAEETIIKTLEANLKAQLSVDIIKRLNIPQLLDSLREKAELLEGK
jgi:hypothetical protein